MNRRALIALLSVPLGSLRLGAQVAPALLTIDLNQWSGIKVVRGKRVVVITADEIFEALNDVETK